MLFFLLNVYAIDYTVSRAPDKATSFIKLLSLCISMFSKFNVRNASDMRHQYKYPPCVGFYIGLL